MLTLYLDLVSTKDNNLSITPYSHRITCTFVTPKCLLDGRFKNLVNLLSLGCKSYWFVAELFIFCHSSSSIILLPSILSPDAISRGMSPDALYNRHASAIGT